MSKEVIVPIIQLAIALILGYFVARKSNAEQPIKGGTLAQVFHYLGAATFVAVGPSVLLNALVLKLPFLPNVLSALAMLAVAGVFLIIYAVFEAPKVSTAK
jgi:hypothetical protein